MQAGTMIRVLALVLSMLVLSGCTSYEEEPISPWLRMKVATPTVVAAHVIVLGDSFRRIEKRRKVGWKTVSDENIWQERSWTTGDDQVLVVWRAQAGRKACAFARKGDDQCVGPAPGLSLHPARDGGVHVLQCADKTCAQWLLGRLSKEERRKIPAPTMPVAEATDEDDEWEDDLLGAGDGETGCVPALVGWMGATPVASSSCGTYVLTDPIRKLDSTAGVELSKPVSRELPGQSAAGFPIWW